jgi:hypothetical protein
MAQPRRFPPPWSVEDIGAAYVVKDGEPGRHSAAKMLSKDEARRIATNVAKLRDQRDNLLVTCWRSDGRRAAGLVITILQTKIHIHYRLGKRAERMIVAVLGDCHLQFLD